MKIQNALVSNILDRSQRHFAHVTTVTLSWRVQNIVVIGHVYFTLECFEFSSNFEFDRNMLSGTGAWTVYGLMPNIGDKYFMNPQFVWLACIKAVIQYKDCLSRNIIQIIQIRQSWDHFIFGIAIPVLVRQHRYREGRRGFFQYEDDALGNRSYHYKDKTVVRLSYL